MSKLLNDRLFINNIGDLVEIQHASYYSFLHKGLIDELTKTIKPTYQIFLSKDLFGFDQFFLPKHYLLSDSLRSLREFSNLQDALYQFEKKLRYYNEALEEYHNNVGEPKDPILYWDLDLEGGLEKNIEAFLKAEKSRNGFTCRISSSTWLGFFDPEDVFIDFPKEDAEMAARFGETYSFNLGFYMNYYFTDQFEIPRVHDRILFESADPTELCFLILQEKNRFTSLLWKGECKSRKPRSFVPLENFQYLTKKESDFILTTIKEARYIKILEEQKKLTEKGVVKPSIFFTPFLEKKLNTVIWNFSEREITSPNLFQLSLFEIFNEKKKTIFDFCLKFQNYWTTIPLMTKEGTFVINGCERVVISQTIKSPGVIFQRTNTGKKKYKATVITQSLSKYDFEFANNFAILFAKFSYLIEEKFKRDKAEEMLKHKDDRKIITRIYSSRELKENLLLTVKLGFIPSYSIKLTSSRKLSFPALLSLFGISTIEFFDGLDIPVFFPWSPEKIRKECSDLIKPFKKKLEDETSKDENYKLLEDESNEWEVLKKIRSLFDFYLKETENQLKETKNQPQKEEEEEKKQKNVDPMELLSVGPVGRHRMNKKFSLSLPLTLVYITVQDLVVIINQLYKVEIGQTTIDDIDDLKNKQIRGVGEQLHQNIQTILSPPNKNSENNFSNFKNRRLDVMDFFRVFFVQNPLSQYFDQLNPLSEVTHKRRVSVFGTEGIERGGAITNKMRDIHPSYYGKFCPIETPEGENAGLVTTLALFAKKSSLGLLETPYYYAEDRKLFVQHAPIFLDSYDETSYNFLLSNYALEKKKFLFPEDYFVVKEMDEFIPVFSSEINFAALHSSQILSLATSLVPFIEHNDGNRALMGANMQRQALPLLSPNLPIVGTGFETITSLASGLVIRSYTEGYVTHASSSLIEIRDKKTQIISYLLKKYKRSNQATSLNQSPAVWVGEYIFRGQIIVDTPSTISGELSLGNNLTVAYMPWQGYNYEDAIVISEKLVVNDVLTSLHIERFEDEYFPESDIFTSSPDILNVSPAITLNLTSEGIVRIGSYLRPGDIIVGKTTASPSEFSPVKNFLSLIMPQSLKYRDSLEKKYKNKSLIVPESVEGRVIDISFNASFDDIGFFIFPKTKVNNFKKFLKILSKDPELVFDFLVNYRYFRPSLSTSAFLGYVRDLSYPPLKVNTSFSKRKKKVSSLDFEKELRVELAKVKKRKKTTKKSIKRKKNTEKPTSKVKPSKKIVQALPTKSFQRKATLKTIEKKPTKGKQDYSLKKIKKKFPRKVRKVFSSQKRYQRRACDLEANQFFETDQSYFLPYYLLKKTLISTSKLFRDYPVISKVTLACSRKIEVGDKLSGRHGNKGIISRILPIYDMPMLPTGEPIDILLNPLGVPSRMNVGQLLEALLGFAGEKLGKRFKVGSFDEAYGLEASRSFVTLKLKEAAFQTNEKWIFTPDYPGKIFLRDGQTGEYFDNPTTVGKAYILKLLHVVHEKIHTRSMGPYNVITQQPLGGKANNGGQRFGEMEVWALEAHGCSYTLQELLTLRSDDLDGRVDISNAMMNEWQEKAFAEGLKTSEGNRLVLNFSYDPTEYPHPSMPQAYVGLVRELNALGLDFTFHQIVHESKGFNSQEEDMFTQLERKLKLKLLIERYEFELFFDIEDQKKAEREAQEKALKEAKENEKLLQYQFEKNSSSKKTSSKKKTKKTL